ncbi:TPA: helix-turn-helix domain-containing protein [Enterobacter hormaechei subsp. steigerwaltii]|nr:helix-turn-helix domain-containing protein [Enterobacter hormaechei subsp. steigerwaltii]
MQEHRTVTIQCILEWIEDNLRFPLTVEKVSNRSGYSTWHLQRMFKEETGYSLGKYIRERKLTEIAKDLKSTDESICYLAILYGFDSQQSLTRTFKKLFNKPPHEYRTTNLSAEYLYLNPINKH